mgnify:CR=1 FL=1
MVHSEKFIFYWKSFLTKLDKSPNRKIMCLSKPDIICKNCDRKKDCFDKNSKLHSYAEKVDKKALENLSMSDGDLFTSSELSKRRIE